jgi:hypothetical protein
MQVLIPAMHDIFVFHPATAMMFGAEMLPTFSIEVLSSWSTAGRLPTAATAAASRLHKTGGISVRHAACRLSAVRALPAEVDYVTYLVQRPHVTLQQGSSAADLQ